MVLALERPFMKILLGNVPWYKNGCYGVRAGSRWPHFEKEGHRYMPFPFFLAYAAALLEKDGLSVSLVDGAAERLSREDFFRRVAEFGPDVLVLEVSTASLKVDLEAAKHFKETRGSKIKIVFCGLHIGLSDQSFLAEHDCVDFTLSGEYEQSLLELVRHLQKNESLDSVPGLNYRDAQGVLRENPQGSAIRDFDRLPWPARHFLPKYGYEDLPQFLPSPTAQMLASRGCPFGCVFCAWPQIMYGDSKYRTRDPLDVADEMEHLVRQEGYKSVYFDDDTFGIDRGRTLRLCEEIEKRGLDVPWAVMTRADVLDEEMLKIMAAAGLRAVKYGVESGSQALVDQSGKQLRLDRVEEVVRITKNLGIKVHLTFMLGLPKESAKTLRQTLRFLLRLDPDSAQFSIATPFPGSRYYHMLQELGHIQTYDWDAYDGSSRAVVKTEFLTAGELEKWLSILRTKWQRHLRYRRLKKRFLSRLFEKTQAVL